MLQAFGSGRLFGEPRGVPPFRILCLHGWAHDHRDFLVLAEELPADEPALLLDLPGFGASPEPVEATNSEGYAALLDEILPYLASDCIVVGHSFGGGVALEFARRNPGRLGGLVLAGVPRLLSRAQGSPSLRYRVVRHLTRHAFLPDRFLERMRQRNGSFDYNAVTGVMREIFVRLVNEDYAETIREIDAPVQLVWGANDTAAPVAMVERALPLFASAALVVLPGVGHQTPLDAPASIVAAIERLR